nr:hypothetical protein [Corynebacterium sp. CNJ-954]
MTDPMSGCPVAHGGGHTPQGGHAPQESQAERGEARVPGSLSPLKVTRTSGGGRSV